MRRNIPLPAPKQRTLGWPRHELSPNWFQAPRWTAVRDVVCVCARVRPVDSGDNTRASTLQQRNTLSLTGSEWTHLVNIDNGHMAAMTLRTITLVTGNRNKLDEIVRIVGTSQHFKVWVVVNKLLSRLLNNFFSTVGLTRYRFAWVSGRGWLHSQS